MADDKARWGGGTPPYEAYLEKKRAALRRALRTEFIRQRAHPDVHLLGKGYIMDTALQRYQATLNTAPEQMNITMRSMMKTIGFFWVPFACALYYYKRDYDSYEQQCRDGKLAYGDPERVFKWRRWCV